MFWTLDLSTVEMKLSLVIFAVGFVGLAHSNPPNFNFDFTGFRKLTQFLPTSCSDIEGQVSILQAPLVGGYVIEWD